MSDPNSQPVEAELIEANLVSESRVRRATFRTCALVAGLTPIVLLAIALNLEPSPQGLGTHQQLGLPPCSMRVMFGIRCPGCGMTTSWSHFMHGNWITSMQVNLGGFLLALASVAGAFLSLRSAWTCELPALRIQRAVTISMAGIGLVTLLDWFRRLLL